MTNQRKRLQTSKGNVELEKWTVSCMDKIVKYSRKLLGKKNWIRTKSLKGNWLNRKIWAFIAKRIWGGDEER